jgi:hypothetical protein
MRAPCEDCGRDTEPLTKRGDPVFKEWDFYLVLDDLWKWRGWRTASCVRPASKSALGRSLQEDDYQFRSVGVNENGLQMVASPEYVAKVGVNRRTRRARRKQAGGTSCYP